MHLKVFALLFQDVGIAMIVNRAKLAEILKHSPRDIARFIDQGMPCAGGGKKGVAREIDVGDAHHWIVEREKKAGAIDPETGEVDINEAKRIKTIEEHRKLKLENDESERQLLPADDVRQAFSAALVELGGLLDGAAGKMASGDAVLRQRLLDEHRRIRETFADRLAGIGTGAANQSPSEAATEEGSVEVG